MATKKGVYFADATEQLLGEISSGRVNQALDRYAEILRRERVEHVFGEAEWNALRDMLNGAISEPAAMVRGSLAMGWEDSLEDGLAEKWDVDPGALQQKLVALTYVQEVAVIEAVERWWRSQGDARA